MKIKKILFLSLVETLVVIILMATLSTTIGISVYKYLETGKAFTTIHEAKQIKNALEFHVSDPDILILSESYGKYKKVENWQQIIKLSPFIHNKKQIFKDAWNKPFIILYSSDESEFNVISEGLKKHQEKHGELSFDKVGENEKKIQI